MTYLSEVNLPNYVILNFILFFVQYCLIDYIKKVKKKYIIIYHYKFDLS